MERKRKLFVRSSNISIPKTTAWRYKLASKNVIASGRRRAYYRSAKSEVPKSTVWWRKKNVIQSESSEGSKDENEPVCKRKKSDSAQMVEIICSHNEENGGLNAEEDSRKEQNSDLHTEEDGDLHAEEDGDLLAEEDGDLLAEEDGDLHAEEDGNLHEEDDGAEEDGNMHKDKDVNLHDEEDENLHDVEDDLPDEEDDLPDEEDGLPDEEDNDLHDEEDDNLHNEEDDDMYDEEDGYFQDVEDSDLQDEDRNSNKQKVNYSQPLYKDAMITLEESVYSTYLYVAKNKLSYKATEQLLELLRLHLPQPNIFPFSFHALKKHFDSMNNMKVTKFCSTCSKTIDKELTKCPNSVCTSSTPSHFALLPFEDQLAEIFSGSSYISTTSY